MPDGRLWFQSGVAGMAAIVCYILAIAIPWPETQLGTSALLLVISGFPIFGIVYSYGLYCFIAAERESTANRLGFVFAVVAFTTLLAMIIVQLAVGASIGEIAKGLDEQTARALRRGLKMIDLGLDVAWDMLIGAALICSGMAMRRRGGLGLGWALPSVGFGIALIALNASTFPWPPADRGLFDIGPFIAAFLIVLSGRLALLGWRASRPARSADPPQRDLP